MEVVGHLEPWPDALSTHKSSLQSRRSVLHLALDSHSCGLRTRQCRGHRLFERRLFNQLPECAFEVRLDWLKAHEWNSVFAEGSQKHGMRDRRRQEDSPARR